MKLALRIGNRWFHQVQAGYSFPLLSLSLSLPPLFCAKLSISHWPDDRFLPTPHECLFMFEKRSVNRMQAQRKKQEMDGAGGKNVRQHQGGGIPSSPHLALHGNCLETPCIQTPFPSNPPDLLPLLLFIHQMRTGIFSNPHLLRTSQRVALIPTARLLSGC